MCKAICTTVSNCASLAITGVTYAGYSAYKSVISSRFDVFNRIKATAVGLWYGPDVGIRTVLNMNPVHRIVTMPVAFVATLVSDKAVEVFVRELGYSQRLAEAAKPLVALGISEIAAHQADESNSTEIMTTIMTFYVLRRALNSVFKAPVT